MCVSAGRWACLASLFALSCTSSIEPSDPDSRSDDASTPETMSTDAAMPQDEAVRDGSIETGELCSSLRVVTDGRDANIRSAPDTSSAAIGTVPDGTVVEAMEATKGEVLGGVDLWYLVRTDTLEGYLFSALAECTSDNEVPGDNEIPDDPDVFDGFFLPFECGKKVRVTQGNFGSYSHKGASKYAFDFSLGLGTPMIAMARGKVSWLYKKTKPGDPCYDGGGPSCVDKANQVWVRHPDGSTTIYAHLSKVLVNEGQSVARGDILGRSGQTGYSTGPHAHVARMKSCCQSIPLDFEDVRGGVPKTGDTVTSGNCPN